MTANSGANIWLIISGGVLLMLGGAMSVVSKLQSKSKVLAVVIALVALVFGDFIEMWAWAGTGLVLGGIGLMIGGTGDVLAFIGTGLILVGFVRLFIHFPARRRRADIIAGLSREFGSGKGDPDC